jgi:hypothetical protein
MDLMDDEDMKKSVIDQMMGELDDVTADSLKKPAGGPVKGVEISIMVSPHHGEGDEEEPKEVECGEEGCMNPDHHHPMEEGSDMAPTGEESYIDQLLKKLG